MQWHLHIQDYETSNNSERQDDNQILQQLAFYISLSMIKDMREQYLKYQYYGNFVIAATNKRKSTKF